MTVSFSKGKLPIYLGTYFLLLVACSPLTVKNEPAVLWTRQFGSNNSDQVTGVVSDRFGNIILVGLTFGSFQNNNLGYSDSFIRKYDTNGNTLWTQQFGTAYSDSANSVAIDNQENIVVVGETTDGISQLTFVRKYNPTGNILWEHQFSKDVSTIGFSVAVDNKGNILIVGGTAANFSKNSPENDLFIHKYDSQGNILWERNFNTLTRHPVNGRGDLETKVTADTLGNIFITGQTNLGLDDNNFSGSDVYLWKCDSDGNVLWTRQLGTSTTAHATGLATDNMNNIVLVGSTENKLSDSRGEGKAFIRKFNPNGTILWTRQFSFGASYNVSGGVTLDSLGNIIISGSTLGGNKNGQVTTYDAFTEKFDPNGDVLWEHFIGTNRPDTALSIATDEANNILITGTTEGNLEGKNNGNTDVFLRKLQP